MIGTGRAGCPRVQASKVRWVSFLQSCLKPQFDSAVLADPAWRPLSWAELEVYCNHRQIHDLNQKLGCFQALACRLLIPHSSIESRWHQGFLASDCRSSVRADLPNKVHVQAARTTGPRVLHITAQRGKGDWSWLKVKNSSGS